MRHHRALALLAVVPMACSALGCSGQKAAPGPTTVACPAEAALKVADIAPAVKAVAAARGGPQRFTEINANEAGVNLFVVDPAAPADAPVEISYVYQAGALSEPGAPEAATQTSFGVDDVAVDIAPKLVTDARARRCQDRVVQVAMINRPDTGLGWSLKVALGDGSPAEIVYDAQGKLLGANVLSPSSVPAATSVVTTTG